MKKIKAAIVLFAMIILVCGGYFFYSGFWPEDITAITAVPVEGDEITPTDYSDESNWAILDKDHKYPVDIFCFYPSEWKRERHEKIICDIDNRDMREGAVNFLKSDGSVFDTVGNYYMPFYRQYSAGFVLKLPYDEEMKFAMGVPRTDAMAAFDYYIENLNESRPFILLSHSQGSKMSKAIVFDYLRDNPDVCKRMIAAYIIGTSVTENELLLNSGVSFAGGSDDFNVIISYNTQSPDPEGPNREWLPGSIAINPIIWTRTDELATAEQNLGSYIEKDGEMHKKMNLADAQVDTEKGLLICSSVDEKEFSIHPRGKASLFPVGIFHHYDIGFYYFNLRANALDRVNAYLTER